MVKYLSIIVIVLLTSCVSLHTPSNHFVPTITAKKQFEGEVSLGTSLSVNASYSPLNHLNIMANAQALPKINSDAYQGSGDIGIGYYNTSAKLIYGINVGYGIGAYNWAYSQRNDSSSYQLETTGQFQKFTLQPFIGLTDNSENINWFTGLSFKVNYFKDEFSKLEYSNALLPAFTGPKTNLSLEPCIFTRNFISRSVYLNAQAGLNISYDESMYWPTQYVFVRVGIGLKLGMN